MCDSQALVGGPKQVMAFADKALASADLTRERVGGAKRSDAIRIAPSQTSIGTSDNDPLLALVGDASFSLDPLSSQGLCHALSSGVAAAVGIDAAVAGSPRFLKEYKDQERACFLRQLETRRMQYSRERRWPDSTFWSTKQCEPSEIRGP